MGLIRFVIIASGKDYIEVSRVNIFRFIIIRFNIVRFIIIIGSGKDYILKGIR